MNINRFRSKREKDHSTHRRAKSGDKSADKKTRPSSSDGFLSGLFKHDGHKRSDKPDAAGSHINDLRLRLSDLGYAGIDDVQITYALNSKHANGDLDKAFQLLVLFQESVEGLIKPYNPNVRMRGAENREAVTCYLDSVLFAMFARLGSFEPILYTQFDDEPRRRLSTLIRLWVNMLRSGMLIQTDVTQLLQEALASCGWQGAAELEQQDTSEAFSFITETLKLPLLTLKMDIYHTGAEDDKDDHKYIHERLLEVAVPDNVPGARTIKLQDCLESYFNNRIEVKRHLLARSNTLSSSGASQEKDSEKESSSQHVEVLELSTPNTPINPPDTPISFTGRVRTASIIRQRVIEVDAKYDDSDDNSIRPSIRKGSFRNEVLMPAWQFFNLMPWYTRADHSSVLDATIAANFARTRPVLGICLKRYGMKEDYTPFRKDTKIDIPFDIQLPHFVDDEQKSSDGSLMGNFKLSLQSIICHRGDSVQKGHYISFIRATNDVSDGDSESNRQLSDSKEPPVYSYDRWIRFDDLEDPRVKYVDIERELKREMPYLLFYQIQPTMDYSPSPGLEYQPPPYADSGIALRSSQSSPTAGDQSEPLQQPGYFDGTSTPAIRLSSEIDRRPRSQRSINITVEERRGSIALTESSLASTASSIAVLSAPVTPSEETTAQRMSRAAQRFTKSGSRSRPSSASGENRISATFSRTINLMKSKEQLNKPGASKELVDLSDGAGDSRTSVLIEENALKTIENQIGAGKSKKDKKREKSKGPNRNSEAEDHHHHHHHHPHLHKGKGREVTDKDCTVM